jgi:hypothetical protein
MIFLGVDCDCKSLFSPLLDPIYLEVPSMLDNFLCLSPGKRSKTIKLSSGIQWIGDYFLEIHRRLRENELVEKFY